MIKTMDNTPQTALITGASSGIGAELARLFAADGIDLILVARNAERLMEQAEELSRLYAVKTTVLPADLSQASAAEELYQAVSHRGISIDYLVNNAGVGIHGEFSAIPLSRGLSMLHLNVDALVSLTHFFLPGMLARKTGKILNVGSLAAFQPGGPGASLYYASKAFVLSFSRGLAVELENSGVSVTALCPGPVATRFQGEGGFDQTMLFQSPLVSQAAPVAKAGYRAMRKGKTVCVPGLSAKLLALGGQLPTHAVALKINQWLLGASSHGPCD